MTVESAYVSQMCQVIAELFHTAHPDYVHLPRDRMHRAASMARELTVDLGRTRAAETALYYAMLAHILDDTNNGADA